MKLIVGLMVTLMIASSIALPVNNPSDDVENVEVLYPERNVEDIEPVYTSFLAPIPISPYSFFDGVEEYFRNIRQRLLSRFLDVADSLELDASKGNSTSEVKIINGHRVEVNNTVYVDKNENGEELFKVRVLHIRPLDLDDSTTQSATGVNSDIDNDEKAVKPQAEGTTAEPEINNEIDQTKSPKTREVKFQSLLSDDLTANDDSYDDNEEQQQTTNLPTMNSAYKISKENIQPLYYETKNDDNQNHNSNSDEEIELYQLNDSQTLQSNNNDNDATKIHLLEQIETTAPAAADDTYTPTTIENVEIGISDIDNDNNINIKTDDNNVTVKDNDNDEDNDDDNDDDDDDTITPDTDDGDDDDDENDDEKDEDDDDNDNNEDTIVVPDGEETELDETPTVDEANNNNIKDDIIDNDSNDDNDIIEKNIVNRNRENFESSEETNDLHTSHHNVENFEDNGEWSTIHKDYNDDEDDMDNDNENIDEHLNEKDNNNNYNNEIDDYESIPIDLSNDINVNYIAQKNGITPDPDAEFLLPNVLNNFHVDNFDNDYYNIKNFKQYEKLTEQAAAALAAEEQTDIDNYESKYYLAGEHNNDNDDDDDDGDVDDSNESERKIPIK